MFLVSLLSLLLITTPHPQLEGGNTMRGITEKNFMCEENSTAGKHRVCPPITTKDRLVGCVGVENCCGAHSRIPTSSPTRCSQGWKFFARWIHPASTSQSWAPITSPPHKSPPVQGRSLVSLITKVVFPTHTSTPFPTGEIGADEVYTRNSGDSKVYFLVTQPLRPICLVL